MPCHNITGVLRVLRVYSGCTPEYATPGVLPVSPPFGGDRVHRSTPCRRFPLRSLLGCTPWAGCTPDASRSRCVCDSRDSIRGRRGWALRAARRFPPDRGGRPSARHARLSLGAGRALGGMGRLVSPVSTACQRPAPASSEGYSTGFGERSVSGAGSSGAALVSVGGWASRARAATSATMSRTFSRNHVPGGAGSGAGRTPDGGMRSSRSVLLAIGET